MDVVDLDSIVSYRDEYSAALHVTDVKEGELFALCPFHHEKTGSFHVNLHTGQFRCFGCGEEGNYVTFYAKIHGVDTKEAYREILRQHGVKPDESKPKGGKDAYVSYSLEDYSRDKQIPVDFLQTVCKVETGVDRDGTKYLKTTYESPGKPPIFRKRYGHKNFRWGRGAKGDIRLYGEWRIPDFLRDQDHVLLVEGESDTQSLWYMEIPALGVPGASVMKPELCQSLSQFPRIYIHQEPDAGGELFLRKVKQSLRDCGYSGDVFCWSCASLGVKDPSDLLCKLGREAAADAIQTALQNADPIDLHGDEITVSVPDEPVHLRQPDGFQFDHDGIASIDPKTGELISVCRTPILLTKRLHSLESGEEKIEIAFLRDGHWRTAIYPRSTLFSSRKVTELADLGCTITSENARPLVRFLGALEAVNLDRIPVQNAVSSFGWQPDGQFLPGHADDITLDIDPSQQRLADAYGRSGSLENWIQTMAPHRTRDIFRFILAASFAAPLLRILKQRIFFVYNWGNSGGGKTAALKAALSAWGDPDRLMVSFNATQAGLERTAAFYCDLPLGIDERQLAGDKPGDLARKVYMISSGIGRTRARRTDGLQRTYQWRTVALATGEEPIATDTTQTGVSTRTLELYGSPFDDESAASKMHQQSATDYGWAGPAFVGKLLQMDEKDVVEQYDCFRDLIKLDGGGKNGAHIACVAAVALADFYISQWFFGATENEAWDQAQKLAVGILQNQVEANASDVNVNGTRFIVDWVISNKAAFESSSFGPCYGVFGQDKDKGSVYIIPSVLDQALEKQGYPSKKIKRYLEEQGLVAIEIDKRTKKPTIAVQKWFQGRNTRMVRFYINKAAGVDAAAEAEEEEGASSF